MPRAGCDGEVWSVGAQHPGNLYALLGSFVPFLERLVAGTWQPVYAACDVTAYPIIQVAFNN